MASLGRQLNELAPRVAVLAAARQHGSRSRTSRRSPPRFPELSPASAPCRSSTAGGANGQCRKVSERRTA